MKKKKKKKEREWGNFSYRVNDQTGPASDGIFACSKTFTWLLDRKLPE